ncbi:DUF6624 domain-containing protein [Victivallis sp. Marseille-Q1083]|uniref:DUF6624 domain-containing protein n=1 Tax=Victivallis sp. Marseille-Q1083 TaxID=2717288 RepID=UPI00158E1D35|nr:DUF6624 domain-containing protein [Victivallis sp. Marseille-Q1083]
MCFEEIARELIQRREHDFAVRQQLLEAGRLYDGYCPEMEQLHRENSSRLEAIIDVIGYPTIAKVGADASNAAWLIIQHAIGRPDFMRKMLRLLRRLPAGEISPRDLAYLEDRINMYEGKPQRYGTQFDWDDDGRMAPVACDDLAAVDRRRRKLGLCPLAEQTDRFRREQDFIPDRETLARHRRQYHDWLVQTGWRRTGNRT